jgi:hypothetical protein
MVLRSLVATYQRCSVSLKAGRSTYIPAGVKEVAATFAGDIRRIAGKRPMMACTCALTG